MESGSLLGHVRASTVMVVLGAGCVVLGGLIAALTGPLDLLQGSWLAAYLVLVCGVAQFAIGTVQSGQDRGPEPMPRARGWVQLSCLNLGNAAVIVGTLVREPLVVDGAVVLLVVAFGIALHAVRSRARYSVGALAGPLARSWASRFLLWGYRVFLVLLLVSLPVGSVLAHVRSD